MKNGWHRRIRMKNGESFEKKTSQQESLRRRYLPCNFWRAKTHQQIEFASNRRHFLLIV